MKDKSGGRWKEGAIVIVIGVLGYVFGHTLAQFVYQTEYVNLLYSFVFAVFLIALFFLQSVFVRSTYYAGIFVAGEVLLMTTPLFLEGKSGWPFLIGAVTALLLFSAHAWGKRNLENMLEITVWGLSRHLMGTIFFAVTFFSVCNYVVVLHENNLTVSREGVEVAFVPFQSVARRFLPNISSESSVQEFLEELTRRTYKSQLEEIPFEERQNAVDQAVSNVRNTINTSLNVKIGLNENIIDAIQKSINAFVKNAPQQMRQTILIIITALLFLTIGGGGYIVSLCATAIAWILYQLLLASGFAYITMKDTQQEIIKIL